MLQPSRKCIFKHCDPTGPVDQSHINAHARDRPRRLRSYECFGGQADPCSLTARHPFCCHIVRPRRFDFDKNNVIRMTKNKIDLAARPAPAAMQAKISRSGVVPFHGLFGCKARQICHLSAALAPVSRSPGTRRVIDSNRCRKIEFKLGVAHTAPLARPPVSPNPYRAPVDILCVGASRFVAPRVSPHP